MKFDFDEIISRKDTNSLNYDGWRQYIFNAGKDAQFPFSDEEYIRLWVADMDFSTPPAVLNAIRKRLDAKILGYTRIYDDAFSGVINSWCLRQYNWEVDTTEMVVSPGIIPALNRLVPLLINTNEALLILTPSYTPFKKAGDYSNRNVFTSSLIENDGHYSIDFDDIESKIKNSENKIKLFVFCNPHNPTGRIWSEEELKRVGEICIANGVWIISDEIHCDLLREGKKHTPLAKLFPESDRILTCIAPSKTFNLAGNLVSLLFIKNNSIRDEWLRLYDDFLSPLSVEATRAAYSQCDEWLKQLKNYLDGNFEFLRDFVEKELPEARFNVPESTYLAWIDITKYIENLPDRNQLSLFFATHSGVLIEGGNMFVADGDGYIRINVAVPRAVLHEGLRRLAKTLRTLIN